MSAGQADQIDVLLVENDSADAYSLTEAFDELSLEISIHVATNGADALSRLSDTADESLVPDLIILDLQLPRMSGFELLEEIDDEPALCRLPILVLTRSATVEEVKECYKLAANAYLTKPSDAAEYAELAETIADFWFRHVALPTDAF